jgi:hypothetical protein
MILFIALGVISGVFGILFLFAPKALIYLSELSNRIFMTDEVAIRFRTWVGIVLLFASVLMFFVAAYLTKL